MDTCPSNKKVMLPLEETDLAGKSCTGAKHHAAAKNDENRQINRPVVGLISPAGPPD